MTASARQGDVVAAAVESLPPEYREALVAAFFQRRTAAQAARTLGLPVPVVKARIYEALRLIHRATGVLPVRDHLAA